MIVAFRGSAKSIFPWKCPIQKYRSLFSKNYLLTPCVLRDMLVLDISKISKSERNRGRQRRLQIFQKNFAFKTWKIDVKWWIYWTSVTGL